jgi:hypothetical protein
LQVADEQWEEVFYALYDWIMMMQEEFMEDLKMPGYEEMAWYFEQQGLQLTEDDFEWLMMMPDP